MVIWGAGASLTAIKGGIYIDTTMGCTPLEGLVMATRSCSIDPGLLLELMSEGYSAAAMAKILQQKSGLKGLSVLSGDMREIRTAAEDGHNGAIRVLRVFSHRLVQMLSGIAARLQGVDELALTEGNGEHVLQLQDELRQVCIDVVASP